MKVTAAKLKTAMFITLAVGGISCFGQAKTTMYVMKDGKVVFESAVSDVDNVTFDEAAFDDALFLQKTDGAPAGKFLLNNIQQVSFSGESLSVETSAGSETVAFADIAKLLFGNSATGINKPKAQSSFDVLAYLNPAGDVVVETSAAIRSLTVFGIDGKTIAATVETGRALSLQNAPAGVYLLRVETEQGIVVKKIVKPSKK